MNSGNGLSVKMFELHHHFNQKAKMSGQEVKYDQEKDSHKKKQKDREPLSNENMGSQYLLADIEEDVEEGNFTIPNTPGGMGVSRNIMKERE